MTLLRNIGEVSGFQSSGISWRIICPKGGLRSSGQESGPNLIRSIEVSDQEIHQHTKPSSLYPFWIAGELTWRWTLPSPSSFLSILENPRPYTTCDTHMVSSSVDRLLSFSCPEWKNSSASGHACLPSFISHKIILLSALTWTCFNLMHFFCRTLLCRWTLSIYYYSNY